jgi:hypothetical protein
MLAAAVEVVQVVLVQMAHLQVEELVVLVFNFLQHLEIQFQQ